MRKTGSYQKREENQSKKYMAENLLSTVSFKIVPVAIYTSIQMVLHTNSRRKNQGYIWLISVVHRLLGFHWFFRGLSDSKSLMKTE